ncbi:tryptophanase [Halarsenatibacter silvermanii]|uniref:Tryptophanase n=1 Tax=Halarsenatibacter silvermanii TaxID=321763 RepID=A0A1G9RIE8_9FIRM|nr:tryptophanase [Halarsenatibacter silvermanii]SDM23119.1 tryptophanase [Halarsenatibacter silvermanii]
MDGDFKAEPFKIKAVEPIQLIPRREREEAIQKVGYNLFSLNSDQVYIDLLTDSGTGAMSDRQWAGLMQGDESYAGSDNYQKLVAVVQELFDYEYTIPAHQGRGAEQVLFPLLAGKGQYGISNMHFDTTKAHVELAGAKAVDMFTENAVETGKYHPFKGNLDVEKAEEFIQEKGTEKIAFIIMTITCNSAGGQPVSLENIKNTKLLADRYDIPLLLDAARFAENAYFIKQREEGYQDKTIKTIVKEMFSYAEAFTLSAKKDAIANIGGLIGIKDDEKLYKRARSRSVPLEGFPTYGGLAGRDMEAIARGLREVIQLEYLDYRIGQVKYLGDNLREAGIPIQYPVGGHAVFVDAGKMAPHIPHNQFPGQALGVELYKEAGVRGVEVGTLLLGRDPDTGENLQAPLELLRLAIPRRVYTDNHLDVVTEGMKRVRDKADQLSGLKFTYEPEVLRHFTAKFEPVK